MGGNLSACYADINKGVHCPSLTKEPFRGMESAAGIGDIPQPGLEL